MKVICLLAASQALLAGFVCAQVVFPDSCVNSGVHFSKFLYHVQTGPADVVPDSRSLPLFQAVTNLGTAPHGALLSAILHVPTVPETILDFGHVNIDQRFNSEAELEAAYPQAGAYTINLSTSTGSGSFQLSFPSEGWPPPPRLLNFSAAQAIHPRRDFVLQLEPFPGSSPYRVIVAIVLGIFPPHIILSEPPPGCGPITYPHVPRSIIIPRRTLAPNTDYFLVLAYTRAHVAPNTIGGFSAASALARGTRVPIRTTDGRSPVFQAVRTSGSNLILDLEVPASSLVVVQTSTSLKNPDWQTVASFSSPTEQTISITNTISSQSTAAFLRAFAQ